MGGNQLNTISKISFAKGSPLTLAYFDADWITSAFSILLEKEHLMRMLLVAGAGEYGNKKVIKRRKYFVKLVFKIFLWLLEFVDKGEG